MHKGKKCKLNQPNSKKIRMEKSKPNKGRVSNPNLAIKVSSSLLKGK